MCFSADFSVRGYLFFKGKHMKKNQLEKKNVATVPMEKISFGPEIIK